MNKNLIKSISKATVLLVILVAIFGAFGVVSILCFGDGEQSLLFAIIQGAITVIIIIAIIIVVSTHLNAINKSLKRISTVVAKLANEGHIDDNNESFEKLKKESEKTDEFGVLAKNFLKMIVSITAKISTMDYIAKGDLTKRAALVSDEDSLGIAINQIVDNLNSMLDDIRKTSDQLNMGIIQFSSAAQSLAQSTAEQSATIEQLLLSVKDVSEKSNENTTRSQQATTLSSHIHENAQGGRDQMSKMTQAMDDINSASQSISTVMKAIDDIAFQTNILSLNAAVEAARAGQHGKGFAVVADEVRNLATKSATAASDSNDMISNTLRKSKQGSEIVKDTSDSLNTILSGITDSALIIDEIAGSTEAQSMALEEINNGINQFSNVVYQNSATAEQSAAASDEMSIQTAQLVKLVDRFIIDEEYIAKKNKSGNNNSFTVSSFIPDNTSSNMFSENESNESTDSFAFEGRQSTFDATDNNDYSSAFNSSSGINNFSSEEYGSGNDTSMTNTTISQFDSENKDEFTDDHSSKY